jgi:anti-anti-sigma regulatory factor
MVVRMTTNVLWIPVDPEHVDVWQEEAAEKLNRAESEVVLDFCSVNRIDSNGVMALEELARLADERSTKVVLRAVNIDIYRVLKLLKLAHRFTILT